MRGCVASAFVWVKVLQKCFQRSFADDEALLQRGQRLAKGYKSHCSQRLDVDDGGGGTHHRHRMSASRTTETLHLLKCFPFRAPMRWLDDGTRLCTNLSLALLSDDETLAHCCRFPPRWQSRSKAVQHESSRALLKRSNFPLELCERAVWVWDRYPFHRSGLAPASRSLSQCAEV